MPEQVLTGEAIVLKGEKVGRNVQLVWLDVPEEAVEAILYKEKTAPTRSSDYSLPAPQATDYRPDPGLNRYQLAARMPDGALRWSNVVEVHMDAGLLSGIRSATTRQRSKFIFRFRYQLARLLPSTCLI
ncbi:MAG: hypothetical protein R3B47_06650 [Bacteroidia bacterium]